MSKISLMFAILFGISSGVLWEGGQQGLVFGMLSFLVYAIGIKINEP